MDLTRMGETAGAVTLDQPPVASEALPYGIGEP